jgi:hypothetical protein
MSKLKIRHEEREPVGLRDGGHIILKCANCAKPLVDIWRTRPNEKDPRTDEVISYLVAAECCYCGDKSYVKEIKGGFHVGGYGTTKVNDPTANIQHVSIVSQEPYPGREDVILFKTMKANK